MSDGWIICGLEGLWKEVVMVSFKVLSQNFPGRIIKNHEKTQNGWLIPVHPIYKEVVIIT
jgi:hypothetical protein